MEVNKVIICDKCKRIIADKKCPLCKTDICNECSKDTEVGTLILKLCNDCSKKLERIRYRSVSFWKNFNENEKMEEKIIDYLNKNLILNKLANEDDEEEEDEEELSFPKMKRIKW